MIYNTNALFKETPFDFGQVDLCEGFELSQQSFRMFNDFPSVCELDPNEIIEKKCMREDPFDNLFGTSSLQEKLFEETIGSSKKQFSFSTQELMNESESKEAQDASLSEEVKQEELVKEEDLKKKSPKKRSKRPKITQKVKSFDNRTRFCKKHDREMFLVLNRLCKESQTLLSEFEGTDFPLTDKLMQILEQLITEIKWRKSRKMQLLKRIRKLIMVKTFSTRDLKLLHTLVLQHQKKIGFIDYESMLYYFPGKTPEMLSSVYEPSKNSS
ncbi:unnamed protein product [Moneuplotes crassus]|uniref:Uncharacterized protein n=1 Tax=Euplotes crassus TaxID=5936 RepID=A0AAD1UGX7_EUPCR|nr:unnamed protein product [Moneuplotes crassus]